MAKMRGCFSRGAWLELSEERSADFRRLGNCLVAVGFPAAACPGPPPTGHTAGIMRSNLRTLGLGILGLLLLPLLPLDLSPLSGGDDALVIGEVQGTGQRSPFAGRRVTVEGVVTGAFAGDDLLGGFFIQDGDASGDTYSSGL